MEIERKSTLAKLLATENITLEHKKVPTAYFDLKERKVVLPILKSDISNELYDLFIGHEVSHALNTPLEGWHDSIETKGRGFKSFLNVVEDARIERDIKKRFPGLTKSFFKGYRELFEMDFFGLGDNNINDYPLIDRINLFYKVGMFANVEFTSEEQVFVDRVARCETWDDVVDVSNELYDYAKEEEDTETNLSDAFHGDQDEESDEDGFEPSETSGSETQDDQESDEGETHDSDDSGESNEEQESDSSDSESSVEDDEQSFDSMEDDYADEPVSVTDQNFRNNEGKLIDQNTRGDIQWVNFPKLDYKKFVNMNALDGVEKHLRDINKFYSTDTMKHSWFDDADRIGFDECGKTLVNNFNKKNRPFLNLMVSQFEAKRKANQLAKSREHKTGDLNMNKLWATKLTEDVFLSSTVTPDGKNHGMLMVIDFSGSMYNKMQATIEQMLLQVAFCRKVGIPFEVYSFTCGYYGNPNARHHIDNQKEGDLQLVDTDLSINRLLHSGMSSTMYKKAHQMMLMVGSAYSDYRTRKSGAPYCNQYDLPNHLGLGGTPLDSTILLMRDIAIDFRNNNRIDVLNTLFLTDGGNTGHLGMGNQTSPSRSYVYGSDRVAIRENGMTTMSNHSDRLYSSRFNDVVCKTLIAHYDKTTGSRTVNYFLSDAGKNQIRQYHTNMHGWNAGEAFEKSWKTEWLSDGYIQMDGLDGFPTAFILRSKDLGEESELEVEGDKKGDLVRGFKKFQKKKTTSRKFLGKFIEKIA